MKEMVRRGITELQTEFSRLTFEDGADGGALVCLPAIELGAVYQPSTADLLFILGPSYKETPIYPLYLEPQVSRAPGHSALGELQQLAEWQWTENAPKRRVTQVSLRSHQWDPETENALSKVTGVLHWLRTH